MIRTIIGVAAAATLAACTSDARPKSAASDAPARNPGKAYERNPYPSTYRAYPGVPTLLTNVTILDGEGGRIDNGAVLFRDGKIVKKDSYWKIVEPLH